MNQGNSSTSNSDWDKFLKILITVTVSAASFLYLSIYLIDPYDVFEFSPDASRPPVSSKRRHFTPGIARQPHFDSFILGSSTVMLLKPQRLDKLLHTKIANLSLPSGSPYEQLRLASLFMEHHKELNLIIVSVDAAWCAIEGAKRYLEVGNDKLEESRKIQEWMYSSNFWQQFPPINKRIVKDTRRQLLNIFGFRSFRYGADGYSDFTRRFAKKYDSARIHKNLYSTSKSTQKQPLQAAIKVSNSEIKKWLFPDIKMLKKWLTSLPPSTRKILLFPPYHHYHLPQTGSMDELKWNECKNRTAKISLTVPQVSVFDFMISSPITTEDSNYWDPLHYTVAIANKIEDALGKEVMGQSSEAGYPSHKTIPEFFRLLGSPI